jgi:hypothetical protein
MARLVRCGKIAKAYTWMDRTQILISSAQATLSTSSTAIGDSPAPIAETGHDSFRVGFAERSQNDAYRSSNPCSRTSCYKFLRPVPYSSFQ